MPNFSSLAGLEVAEEFVVVEPTKIMLWASKDYVVEHVTTVSNSNASCFRVALSWVALGFDNSYSVANLNFNSNSNLVKSFVSINFILKNNAQPPVMDSSGHILEFCVVSRP